MHDAPGYNVAFRSGTESVISVSDIRSSLGGDEHPPECCAGWGKALSFRGKFRGTSSFIPVSHYTLRRLRVIGPTRHSVPSTHPVLRSFEIPSHPKISTSKSCFISQLLYTDSFHMAYAADQTLPLTSRYRTSCIKHASRMVCSLAQLTHHAQYTSVSVSGPLIYASKLRV